MRYIVVVCVTLGDDSLATEIKLKYKPHPLQLPAHKSTAPYILFGGAIGGGKSVWGVNDMLQCALDYEKNVVGIFRMKRQSFMETTYKTMEEWILQVDGLVKSHNRSSQEIILVNGSRIVYGGLMASTSAAGDPFERIKSLEIASCYVDEITDVPEDMFDFLCGRIPRLPSGPIRNTKTGKKEYPPPRLCAGSNPELSWVKTRWIDKRLDEYEFFPSRADQNPYNPPEYYERLRKTMPPSMVARYVDGNWDAVIDFESIYPAPWIVAATKRNYPVGEPVEFGVDVATFGMDKTIIMMRQGYHPTMLTVDEFGDTTKTANKVAIFADEYHPEAIKVDSVGVGQGVFDQLNDRGYPVVAIVGGAKPADPRFVNLRAEMYWEFRNLLETGEVEIPDVSELINELGQIHIIRQMSDKKILVESKASIKKRIGRSPDYADALIYCFYGAGSSYSMGELV